MAWYSRNAVCSRQAYSGDKGQDMLETIQDKILNLFHNLTPRGLQILLGSTLAVAILLLII